MWFLLALALLTEVSADPSSRETLKQVESNMKTPSQKQHEREDQFQLKEMIVYLTPTQIKDIESGKAVLEHQYTYPEPTSQKQYQQSQLSQEKAQLQTTLNEGQHIQQQIDNYEANQKTHLQHQEIHASANKFQHHIENLATNHEARLQLHDINSPANSFQQNIRNFEALQEITPLINNHAPKQTYQLQEGPKQDSYQEYQQQQLLEQIQHSQELQRGQYLQNQQPLEYSYFNQQESQKPHLPQNYAFQYYYPNGKQLNSENLHLIFPEAQQPKFNEQTLIHQLQKDYQNEELIKNPLPPKFQMIPYEYNPRAQLEAQKLLGIEWANFGIDSKLEEAKDIGSQPQKNSQELSAAHIIAAQHHKHKAIALQQAAHQLQAHKFDAIRQHTDKVKALQNEAEAFHNKYKEQEKRLVAQHKEAERLDAELEKEEYKAEVAKAEEKFFGSFRKGESEKDQHLTILAPLLKHDQIKDSFKFEKPSFLNQPKFEGGFKPLKNVYNTYNNKALSSFKIEKPISFLPKLDEGFQLLDVAYKNYDEKPLGYAPQFYNEKYAKELKETAEKNQIEKAKAYAKAAAISKEHPAVIVHEEVKVTRPIQVVKHVNIPVPQPIYVPVPSPFEVKVPQPYPVPLEIIRHIPVPVVKTEKIEIEKPVPVEVEKHVPVPVTKNVYIPVEKPYYVERVVPVEVTKEIPVEKVVHRPQTYTIIKHVWKH